MRGATFSLEPLAPFRLDLTAWAIRRRPDNQVDTWDGETYARVLVIGGAPVPVAVRQSGGVDVPVLRVRVSGARPAARVKAGVTAALERLLGLRIDLGDFHALAAGHARLGELAARFRGLKPPRFPTVWEALVNGIACQQLSLNVGILVLNRLAAAYGPAVDTEGGVRHAFPRPEDIAAAKPADLRELGFSGAKGRALIEAAQQISGSGLDLEAFSNLGNEEAISRLLRLRGVGRWTAEYTLLRGMGRVDVFPGDDIGARNNLARWLRLRKPLDYGRVAQIAGRWNPFEGLIYFHLLLDSLERAGYLASRQSGLDVLRSRTAQRG